MEGLEKHLINKDADIHAALVKLDALSREGATLTLFVMEGDYLVGTITDGDIRRALLRNITLEMKLEQIMNKDFKCLNSEDNNVLIIRKLKSEGIKLLPCIDRYNHLLKIYDLANRKSILPVDAVLMAGGKGERLRPLTEKIPKPLLKVGNKSIIDYNIDNLISYGVENIFVTTNYLAEQVENHFVYKRQDIQIKCVREKKYLGTIASVKLIPDLEHKDILVMNSDLLTNIDFEDFYCHFIDKGADMSIAAIPYTVTIPYGIFELNGSNVKNIKEKPSYNYYANAGIYFIKKEILNWIPDETFYNATDLMNLLISKNKTVVRYPMVGYWIDIGNPEEYRKANELVKHINGAKH